MTAEQGSEPRQPARHSQPDSLHPEKRLAGGMGDVVHLFLTQPSGDGTASPTGVEIPSSRERAVPSRPVIVVARQAPSLGKEEITQLLIANTADLESGLRAIDRAVPCDPSLTIDILAVDSLGQPVLIAVEAAPDDGMLLRAISGYDWIIGHVPILRKLYPGQVIHFASQPRVLLVAPEFSRQLTCAVHRIPTPRIGCYRYRAIAVPSGTAVLFEEA